MRVYVAFVVALEMFLYASNTVYAACANNVPRLRPDSRYELVAGATPAGSEVRDKVTGLIWQRCVLGMVWDGATCTGAAATTDWQGALDNARVAVRSSVPDARAWRVPSYSELSSLADRSCSSPAINENWFPATVAGETWTSSPSMMIDPVLTTPTYIYAWLVTFNQGNAYSEDRSQIWSVRFVR